MADCVLAGVGFDNAYYWDIGRQNLNTGDFEFRYGDASAVETVKMLIQLGPGNVGIGTAAPTKTLTVNGDIDFNTGADTAWTGSIGWQYATVGG